MKKMFFLLLLLPIFLKAQYTKIQLDSVVDAELVGPVTIAKHKTVSKDIIKSVFTLVDTVKVPYLRALDTVLMVVTPVSGKVESIPISRLEGDIEFNDSLAIYARDYVTFNVEVAQDSALNVGIQVAVDKKMRFVIGRGLSDTLFLRGGVNIPSNFNLEIYGYIKKLPTAQVPILGDYVLGDSVVKVTSITEFEIGDFVSFYDSRFPNAGGRGCKDIKTSLQSYKILNIENDSLYLSHGLKDTIPSQTYGSIAFQYNNLMQADGQNNINVSGTGVLDFNKEEQQPYVSAKYNPPSGSSVFSFEPSCALLFNNCQDISVQDLKFKNAIMHNLSFDYVTRGFVYGVHAKRSYMKNILNLFGTSVDIIECRADSSLYEDGIFVYGYSDGGYNNVVGRCITEGNARSGMSWLSQVNMMSYGNKSSGNGMNFDFWLSSGTSFSDKAIGGREYQTCGDTLQSVKIEVCENLVVYDLEIEKALKTGLGAEGENINVHIHHLLIDTAEIGYSDLPFEGKVSQSIYLYYPIFRSCNQNDSIGNSAITINNPKKWDEGYDYSQIGHLPLTGGVLSDTLAIQKNVSTGDNFLGLSILNENNSSGNARSSSMRLGFNSTVGTHYGTLRITEASNNSNTGSFQIDLPFGGVEATRLTMLGNGNLGLGITGPTSRLEVDGDIKTVGSSNGLILESPDGTMWRVTVDNAGVLLVNPL